MAYLRTPEERFEGLSDFPYKPHYLQNENLRMAYIDERAGSGTEEVFLCLHGEPTWSYLYRKMIAVFLKYTTGSKDISLRVVAPDFFGFGRSDKPRQDATYDFDFHRNSLLYLIEKLDLRNITLIGQDWGGMIGLTRLIVMNTTLGTSVLNNPGVQGWVDYNGSLSDPDPVDLMAVLEHKSLSEEEKQSYRAPFPGETYKAGVRRFPQMLMLNDSYPGVDTANKARLFYETTDIFKKQDVVVVAGLGDLGFAPYMKDLGGHVQERVLLY